MDMYLSQACLNSVTDGWSTTSSGSWFLYSFCEEILSSITFELPDLKDLNLIFNINSLSYVWGTTGNCCTSFSAGTVASCASYQPSYIIFYQLQFLDTTVKVGCNLYMVSHSKLVIVSSSGLLHSACQPWLCKHSSCYCYYLQVQWQPWIKEQIQMVNLPFLEECNPIQDQLHLNLQVKRFL